MVIEEFQIPSRVLTFDSDISLYSKLEARDTIVEGRMAEHEETKHALKQKLKIKSHFARYTREIVSFVNHTLISMFKPNFVFKFTWAREKRSCIHELYETELTTSSLFELVVRLKRIA